jgi:GNAT superfamily N-acetyltransferase
MELLRCMGAIEDILSGAKGRRPFVLRPHRVGDMGWVVYSEGLGYALQFGWDESFEALVAKIVADFITNYDASRERCWIAEIDGQHAGHIFLVTQSGEPGTARLRLLYVEPSARGLGLGEALVTECIRFARTAGYQKVVLWTQSILIAAHRIYQRAGFRLVKEEAHHSFGHDLVGQEWELELGCAGLERHPHL